MSIVTLNDRAVRSVSAFGSLNTGSMVFIKKLTASSSATLSFVDGASSVVLDNTYKEYLFTFNSIHPGTDSQHLSFQGSTNTGSSYGVTTTSTLFRGYHNEGDTATGVAYRGDYDVAQGTGFIPLADGDSTGADNDQTVSGYIHLFNPSSTTFVKHFISRFSEYHQADYSIDGYVAGYFNTTSAIDAIQFKMGSGNIDAGDICLYGIL
jgi:hypothetical protein